MPDEHSSDGPDGPGATDVAESTAGVVIAERVAQPQPVTGVVVGVDGSRSALAAVTWAAAEAARRGAELHLVEVLPPAESSENRASIPRGRARALLYRAMGTALAVSPTMRVSMATVYGRVGPALVSYAAGADLLVVGSNGPGGPIPLTVGRVLAEVTAHAECPAVVVPTRRAGSSALSSRPVLVAVGGTAEGERALAFAAETAHRWAVPLVALTSTKRRHRSGRDDEHGLSSEDLARYREQYPGLTIESRVIGGSQESVLGAVQGAQLIVVSSLRRDAAAGALLGWTMHFLPILSPCAVAVVPRHTHRQPNRRQ